MRTTANPQARGALGLLSPLQVLTSPWLVGTHQRAASAHPSLTPQAHTSRTATACWPQPVRSAHLMVLRTATVDKEVVS